MAEGYIRLHRSAIDHPVVGVANGSRFIVWTWLLAKACWKPTSFNANGHVITLKRGQFCASIREISKQLRLPKSTVERAISDMKKRDMVRVETGTGLSLITVCNYDKYQNVETGAGQQRDSSGTQKKKVRREEEIDTSLRSVSSGYPPEFETFWKECGRRGGKKSAFTAWKKALERGVSAARLQSEWRHRWEIRWRFLKGTSEECYIPHLSTWLNDDGWEGELAPHPRYAGSKVNEDLEDFFNGQTHDVPGELGTTPRDSYGPTLEGDFREVVAAKKH